jgi:hypothetical protein
MPSQRNIETEIGKDTIMNLRSLMIPLLAVVVVLAGCQNAQKMSANAAITSAKSAFGPVKDAAEKYVPDETAAVESSINAAQTAYNNGDYAGALAAAKTLPSQISALASAAKAKKDELTQQWTSLYGSLPGLMTAVSSKASALAAQHKLPASANDQLSSAKSLWGTATAAFSSGDLTTAVNDGASVKEKLESLASMLHVRTR